ncbi:MAG: hypothetical protein HY303_21345 [Candidatus Wallbacteria bacterium]|nr:hypothetical protein [Candidatus Wallbacteria bacterium]
MPEHLDHTAVPAPREQRSPGDAAVARERLVRLPVGDVTAVGFVMLLFATAAAAAGLMRAAD